MTSPSDDPGLYLLGGHQGAQPAAAEAVGGKAHNLMRLDAIGLPVPPAFVLGTSVCRDYLRSGGRLSGAALEQLGEGLRHLERSTGRRLGDARNPLLVAVRSGAPVSMPGMLATLLNIGLNETTVRGLIRLTGNPRLAWDCYRRLVQGFAETVGGCQAAPFHRILNRCLEAEGLAGAEELDSAALRAITREFLDLSQALSNQSFPQDPMHQLKAAVEAVFNSWNGPAAVAYRRLHGIPAESGTAVTVQVMVFGNAGGTSGSGVGFTRNPATGEPGLYMDFLFNAQGEDVVAGRRPLSHADHLREILPAVHAELERIRVHLERSLGDLQDFEFTVEDRRLYLLQTRAGKRTPWAALRVAVDLVDEGLIDPATALERLQGIELDALERTRLRTPPGPPLARAVPASLGVASGAIALDSEQAQALADGGEPVILVREDASTADIQGLAACRGVLTAGGGRTSHAAVVARQLGRVCLVACPDLHIDLEQRRCRIGDESLAEGSFLSLDGDSGGVYAGALDTVSERPLAALARVEDWRRSLAAEPGQAGRGAPK